jgi:ABC-type Fe3+ transport system substrate-binding protein
VSEIALYDGPDRQAILEAGARTEGKLMVYTSGVDTQIGPLIDGFSAKYPFVKVDRFRASNEELIPRILEEYRANRFDFDTLETTTDSTSLLKEANVLQSFRSPELANYPKDSIDPDSMFAPVRESYVGLGYNPTQVKTEDAPKSFDDLLDPRWKGRMTIAGSSTGVRFVGNVLLTKGPDFLKQLGEQQIRVQNISGRALADLVIAGEVPLSPTIFDSHVADSKGKGAPIEWLPLEPTVVNLGAVSIASHSPHPNAAMLFLDYTLSEEGQKLYKAAGYGSARNGMGGTTTNFKKRYLENDVKDYPASFTEWQRLLNQTFVKS